LEERLHKRVFAAGALVALAVSACGGGTTSVPSGAAGTTNTAQGAARMMAVQIDATPAPGNVIVNGGFETGKLSPWTSCGSTSKVIVTAAQKHSGSYSVRLGTKAAPEINGTAAVCQTVTVPTGGILTFWVYEGTTDTITYADQEADVESTSGTVLAQLYSEADTTNGWVEKSFNLSSYAGQTVQLYFGVKGNGYAKDYIYEFLDDVSLTPSSATPPPTSSPTSSPTTSPTTSPTGSPFPCNNAQFNTDQSEFGSGKISADQLVDVCGQVTKVLPEETTSSGPHGYFYVSIPGSSSGTIEIVSNLEAMGEASTDDPPSTWPWVAVGDYVYVQGRYYYDSSSSQGIDWTEDDTDSNWPNIGWAVVCNSSGAACSKYW
jgi:hypothetical protein